MADADKRESPRWIPVSERLPELKDDGVLVFFADLGRCDVVNIFDYFRPITAGLAADGQQKYTLWAYSQGVTHWMDLPEPPKKGE